MLARLRNRRRAMMKAAPAAVIGALFLLSPLLSRQLEPYDYDRDAIAQITAADRNSNAIAVLLGEIRTNLSDFMFLKTERYLHNGVAFAPHLNMEEMAQSGDVEAQQGSTVEASGSLIPAPENDFRGPIGFLHRAVKPYWAPDDPHLHSTGEQLLPWYRIMTISNPHNVRAYQIGAWWLKGHRSEKFITEAKDFLREGIRNNPDAFQLPLMMGYIYNQEQNREDAWEWFKKAAEAAAQQRPPNPETDITWTHYNEEDARAAMRFAVILERRLGDPANALDMAQRYNAVLGGDSRLQANIEAIKQELVSPGAGDGGADTSKE